MFRRKSTLRVVVRYMGEEEELFFEGRGDGTIVIRRDDT